MNEINLNIIEELAVLLAQKAGLSMADLNNENVPSSIDDEGDVVVDYDAPRWYMDYRYGINKEFHEDIAELLKYAADCKNMLDKSDVENARESLLYLKLAAQQLEGFFDRMKADLDRLLFLKELQWPEFLD